MENIYPHNFLTGVVVRIDFTVPQEDLRTSIPEDLNQEILKYFPILEPKEAIESEIEVDLTKDNEPVNKLNKEKYQEWIYFGKNREKELHITVKFFSIVYHKYERFEELRKDFLSISKLLFSRSPLLGTKRLGLRYINKIFINENRPTDWGKYLDKKLLCIFNVVEDKRLISRAFQTLVFNEDEIRVTFQFGMFNPDFPAVIHKKEFILDFDGAYNGVIQNVQELETQLEKCRKPIKRTFETHITDALRRKMS
jgi:uncharacterized protein (TIGR04255 family)